MMMAGMLKNTFPKTSSILNNVKFMLVMINCFDDRMYELIEYGICLIVHYGFKLYQSSTSLGKIYTNMCQDCESIGG